jgi:hypothetical protein
MRRGDAGAGRRHCGLQPGAAWGRRAPCCRTCFAARRLTAPIRRGVRPSHPGAASRAGTSDATLAIAAEPVPAREQARRVRRRRDRSHRGRPNARKPEGDFG